MNEEEPPCKDCLEAGFYIRCDTCKKEAGHHLDCGCVACDPANYF